MSVVDPVLGPPTLVTWEMVEKPINKMKKSPGHSGVVTEMLKASSDIPSKISTANNGWSIVNYHQSSAFDH